MDHENSILETESLSSSNDLVESQEAEQTVTTTLSSEILTSESSVPRTARDKFFEDLIYENDKNRWSAKCRLCSK